jgi:hypothetical protein
MENVLNHYEEIKAEDFRDLSEIERKKLVQRFIDQVIYDADRFKVAIKLLEKWENNSEQSK